MLMCTRLVFGLVFAAIAAGGAATVVAQESADGLSFGENSTLAVTVTAPASIARGNVAAISVSYPRLNVPLDATCILVLPVNSPAYQEFVLFSRKYTSTGVTAHLCPMYVPPFIQFEGTAIVVAIVNGAGIGVTTFTVTP